MIAAVAICCGAKLATLNSGDFQPLTRHRSWRCSGTIRHRLDCIGLSNMVAVIKLRSLPAAGTHLELRGVLGQVPCRDLRHCFRQRNR